MKWHKRTINNIDLYHSRDKESFGRGYHQWCVQGHITGDIASTLQMKAGYHPAGYGMYKLTHTHKGDGTPYTYWCCWGSCD